MWAELSGAARVEVLGGAGIAVAGLASVAMRPLDRTARAFALLAVCIGLTGILASIGESTAPEAALAAANTPHYTFGSVGAAIWLVLLQLSMSARPRRAGGRRRARSGRDARRRLRARSWVVA